MNDDRVVGVQQVQDRRHFLTQFWEGHAHQHGLGAGRVS